MTKILLQAAVVVTISIAWSGCASAPKANPDDSTLSLVYGYIDMKDAPSSLKWVNIKKYGNPPGWAEAGVEDGVFWNIALAPGSYQVETFGGMGGIPIIAPKRVVYEFGTQGRNATAIRIAEPGVYYMGSYKYKVTESKSGEEQFEMTHLKAIGEKLILRKLIAIIEADSDLRVYRHQLQRAKKHLASLP